MEIDLLRKYPRANRDVKKRGDQKSAHDRSVAKRFGQEFFDGDRKHGYGGLHYNPIYWTNVVQDFIDHYGLTADSKILDVGCAKGFMLYDFSLALPGVELCGIDISDYAIKHSHPAIAENLQVADARNLPFEDNSFDLVISINTVHNFSGAELHKAISELGRVSRKAAFLTVDAYRNPEEKDAMFMWNLTAETILSVSDWKAYFKEIDYKGDYYWFFP